MKTFKMLSFNVLNDDGTTINYPLIDGVIINQENETKTWILEIFIDNSYKQSFEQLKGKEIDVRVVISFPENEPAPFSVTIVEILELKHQISVLMKGKVKLLRQKYAEQLLKNLLEENLSKEELIKKFEQGMKERPRLKS